MSLRDDLIRLFPALRKLPPGAYVVGGAIRDLLLGRTPADVDVASNDPLGTAQAISKRVIRLGREDHLSAYRVVQGEHVYDFAALLDHDVDADLARRDFTINAMAVSLDDGALLDPHHGRDDLAHRIVRMIAAENFDDDPLRMLKAVRMAVRYGFDIDPATVAAIRPRADRIVDVAAERIGFELSAILDSGAFRKAVALLRETRLDQPLFGHELGSYHADDVTLAGAIALLDPKPWRWSEHQLRDAAALRKLIDHHDRIALYDAGERLARQLPPLLRALGRDDALDWPDFAIKSLLNGEEIARLAHVEPGPELGRIKRALLEAQVRGEIRSREEAERFVSAA